MFFMTCKIVYYPDNVIAGTAIFIYCKPKERMFFDQELIKIYLRLDFRVHQGMKVSSLRLMTSPIKYQQKICNSSHLQSIVRVEWEEWAKN